MNSCCRRRCSEAVRLINWAFGRKPQYQIADLGGDFRRERGDNMVELRSLHGDALVVNWASTCANHTSGSAGQYGGSLRWTTATAIVVAEVVASATEGSSSDMSFRTSGHQCCVNNCCQQQRQTANRTQLSHGVHQSTTRGS